MARITPVQESRPVHRQVLAEELTAGDEKKIRQMVRQALKDHLPEMIKREVVDIIGSSRDVEKRVSEMGTEVLNRFVKSLYLKRQAWNSDTKKI